MQRIVTVFLHVIKGVLSTGHNSTGEGTPEGWSCVESSLTCVQVRWRTRGQSPGQHWKSLLYCSARKPSGAITSRGKLAEFRKGIPRLLWTSERSFSRMTIVCPHKLSASTINYQIFRIYLNTHIDFSKKKKKMLTKEKRRFQWLCLETKLNVALKHSVQYMC